jgi:hypothetical protein
LAARNRAASLIVMESRSNLAADLPLLYRAALDAIDRLRELGLRREATRLRDRAIQAYGRAWDERCRRVLEEVEGEAQTTAVAEATRTGRSLPGDGQAG